MQIDRTRLLVCFAVAFLFGCTATAQVVINEIDYDQPSTDSSEFIEIKNTGSTTVNLAGHELQFYNGAFNPAVSYRVLSLPASDLAPGGYFVVCGSSTAVFPCDLDATPDTDLIQNGAPDAVALANGTALLDVVSYEGDAVPFVEGSGAGLADDPANSLKSIARCADGLDTNQNHLDFIYADATPGAANACPPPPPPPAPIVVNEVDSDTPGTDAAEFIELFGTPDTPLDGLAVVLYNGSNDLSYAAFDLDGFTTDAGGFFVLGNADVPEVQLVFAGNLLQNGADAVALYTGNASDFPNNTPVTAASLVDALVYDTADADDLELLNALTPGSPQADEAGAGNSASHANARRPDGGVPFDTAVYVPQDPTPGETNVPPPPPPIGLCGRLQP